MTDEQILAHCYMLGRAAFERGQVLALAADDPSFMDFHNAVLKDGDNDDADKRRREAVRNWHDGWRAAAEEVSA